MSDLYSPEALGMNMKSRRATSKWSWPIIALCIIGALILIIFSAMRQSGTSGNLSPDSTRPSGGRALAELLKREGVDIVTATSLADVRAQAREGVTVFIAATDLLSDFQREQLADLPSDVVLVGTPYLPFGALTDAVDTAAEGSSVAVTAQCSQPDAVAASRISPPRGSMTALRDGVELCFTFEGSGAYAVWEHNGATWRAIADGTLLSNERLANDGNAALAMRSLGQNPTLVWYLPVYEDSSQFFVYAPAWFRSFMWFALLLTVVAIAYWAPRFGPVATESLPVVVRGGEIVRGVGRLYASRRATEHAAGALRSGTIARLQRQLGLSREAGADATITAIAAASSRPAADLRHLLYGPAPQRGADLQELASELTRLESEVHLS